MKRRLAVILAIGVLAGCSHLGPAPVMTPRAARLTAADARSPQTVLAKAAQLYADLRDFRAETTTWAVARPGDPSTLISGTSRMTFKKARMTRFEITKASDDAKKVGTVIVWAGGATVEIRLPKPLFLFFGRRFTLDLADKKLVTPRGVRIDQLSLESILGRMTSRRALVEPTVQETTVEGRPAFVVRAANTYGALDPEVTAESVAFDAETGLPLLATAYVGSQPVLKLGLRQMRVNVGVSDGEFDLD